MILCYANLPAPSPSSTRSERDAWQVDISPVWGQGKEFSAPDELLAPS